MTGVDGHGRLPMDQKGAFPGHSLLGLIPMPPAQPAADNGKTEACAPLANIMETEHIAWKW